MPVFHEIVEISKSDLQYICLNLFPIIYLNFPFLYCSVFYTSTNEICCLLTCRPGHHKHFATISIHLSPRKRGVFLLKSFSQAAVATLALTNEVLNYAKCVTKCDLSADQVALGLLPFYLHIIRYVRE